MIETKSLSNKMETNTIRSISSLDDFDQTKSTELDPSYEEPHLFTNYLLKYGDNDNEDETDTSTTGSLKIWIVNRFKNLSQQNSQSSKNDEMDESNDEYIPETSSSNTLLMPIDFNLLIPKNIDQNSSHELEKFTLSSYNHHNDETEQHLIDDDDSMGDSFQLEQEYGQHENDETNFGYHSLNFESDSDKFSESNSKKVNTIGRSLSNRYRGLSSDVPERRLLMTYPVRRLLMAYFAPRILRFQMAMLLNSVISEISRKIFDPILSNFGIGFGSNKPISFSNSKSSTLSLPLTSSSLPLSLSPSSLSQLAQSLSSLGNGIIPTIGKTSPQTLPPLPSITPSPIMQSVPTVSSSSSDIASTPQSDTSPPANQLSSNVQLSSDSIQLLLNSFGNSDQIKQLLTLATLTNPTINITPQPMDLDQSQTRRVEHSSR